MNPLIRFQKETRVFLAVLGCFPLSRVALAQQVIPQTRVPAKFEASAAPKTIGADFAKISGNLIVQSTGQVMNSAALNPPILITLQQQKQAADLEAGQIMSAAGGNLSGGNPAGAAKGGITLASKPATNVPPPNQSSQAKWGEARNIDVCMAGVTGIRTVNQKTTGVVFTPDPRYNLYTITGCGFGSTPGGIYLQGSAGAFPAHGGKLTLAPVDPTRGWNDRAIIAKLDSNITGELDQNNVSLVVETSTGQRAQANGFSFYAARGAAFSMASIPHNATTSDYGSVDAAGLFVSPCHVLWNGVNVLTDCTLEVYRDGPILDGVVTAGRRMVDTFSPKLKPGFVVSAAMVQISTLRENQGDVLNPYMLKFTGNDVAVTEQPIRKPAPAQDHYFVFYGVTLWVYGPAGITNPLADGQ